MALPERQHGNHRSDFTRVKKKQKTLVRFYTSIIKADISLTLPESLKCKHTSSFHEIQMVDIGPGLHLN